MRINEPLHISPAPHISNQSANEIIYRTGFAGADLFSIRFYIKRFFFSAQSFEQKQSLNWVLRLFKTNLFAV